MHGTVFNTQQTFYPSACHGSLLFREFSMSVLSVSQRNWLFLNQYKAMAFTATPHRCCYVCTGCRSTDVSCTNSVFWCSTLYTALLQSTWVKCATVVVTTVFDPRHSWTSQQQGQELASLTAHSLLQDQLHWTHNPVDLKNTNSHSLCQKLETYLFISVFNCWTCFFTLFYTVFVTLFVADTISFLLL